MAASSASRSAVTDGWTESNAPGEQQIGIDVRVKNASVRQISIELSACLCMCEREEPLSFFIAERPVWSLMTHLEPPATRSPQRARYGKERERRCMRLNEAHLYFQLN